MAHIHTCTLPKRWISMSKIVTGSMHGVVAGGNIQLGLWQHEVEPCSHT